MLYGRVEITRWPGSTSGAGSEMVDLHDPRHRYPAAENKGLRKDGQPQGQMRPPKALVGSSDCTG